MKQIRKTISIDEAVYNSLGAPAKANFSRFINELIMGAVLEKKKDFILAKLKQELLEDAEWQMKLKYAVSSLRSEKKEDDITYTNEWGA